MNNDFKYISELITEKEIDEWKANGYKNIFLDAGTGTGKSYFCKTTLYDYAKKRNEKILLLLPRRDTVQQFRNELDTEKKTDVITVETYQSKEIRQLNKWKTHIEEFQYLVIDEAQYFLSDSRFNDFTDLSFEMILRADCQKIFLSGTAENILSYIQQEKEIPLKVYRVNKVQNINSLYFFRKEETVDELIERAIYDKSKVVVFEDDIQKAYDLYRKYSANAVFNCSQSNKRYAKKRCTEDMDKILETGKLEKLILISTTAFDCGVNITDPDVKNIIIDNVFDTDTIRQCVGRVRTIRENDLALYITHFNNRSLNARRTNYIKYIRMAEFFLTHTLAQYMQAFPRINDRKNVVFEYLDEQNQIKKAVNGLKYYKYKCDIAEIERMLEIKKIGFCEILKEKLNVDKYEFLQEDGTQELANYLETICITKKVFLDLEERQGFIEHLNFRRNYKLIKSKEAINEILKSEYHLPFEIVEFETTRRIDGKKKKYKHAWKVVTKYK